MAKNRRGTERRIVPVRRPIRLPRPGTIRPAMHTVEEALEVLARAAGTPRCEPERVPLDEALGRVLVEPVAAHGADVPPFAALGHGRIRRGARTSPSERSTRWPGPSRPGLARRPAAQGRRRADHDGRARARRDRARDSRRVDVEHGRPRPHRPPREATRRTSCRGGRTSPPGRSSSLPGTRLGPGDIGALATAGRAGGRSWPACRA